MILDDELVGFIVDLEEQEANGVAYCSIKSKSNRNMSTYISVEKLEEANVPFESGQAFKLKMNENGIEIEHIDIDEIEITEEILELKKEIDDLLN